MALLLQRRPPEKRPPHLTRRHALAGLLRGDGTVDWSPWYLTEEEDVGQSGEHGKIITVLLSSLQVLAEEREWSSVVVAADNFFAWVDGEPLVQVSPDIYLLDDPSPRDRPMPRRWEVWREEHPPPRFAVEIVSTEWKKDYEINPARYDHLGVDELVLVDRDAFLGELPSRGQAARVRAPFVVYRRTEEDRLEEVHRGPGPVHSAEIDAWLCFHRSSPGLLRVRVSRSPDGQDLVPTEGEKARAEAERARDAEKKLEVSEQQRDVAEKKLEVSEQQRDVAEKKLEVSEQQRDVAEKKLEVSEKRLADQARKARAAEELASNQAAEIAALRARLQELGESEESD